MLGNSRIDTPMHSSHAHSAAINHSNVPSTAVSPTVRSLQRLIDLLVFNGTSDKKRQSLLLDYSLRIIGR